MAAYLSVWTGSSWSHIGLAFLAGLVFALFSLYLTSAVLHRGICHRAISYPPWLQRAAAVWLWLVVCVPPLAWVATHLHHHANADTEDDPHAPVVKGFWHIFLLTWYYVPRWCHANAEMAEARYLRRFRGERLLRLLDQNVVAKTNFYLQFVISSYLGPVALAFWAARIVPYMLMSGYVNAVGHTHGDRPHDNPGTDATGVWQTIFGYLVGGESLGHNYHHHRPGSSTFRPQEFDPGYWFATKILRGRPLTANRTPAGESGAGSTL